MFERLQEFGSRLFRMTRRSENDEGMDEELRFHLQMRTEQLVEGGISQAEAERRARMEFGGLERTREECRDVLGIRLMYDLVQDIRYAIRGLMRSPGFTIVAVVTLALGIGANTAVFSVVNTLLLQPLPFESPDRLVMIWEGNPEKDIGREQVGWADVDVWRERSTSFESLGTVINQGATSRNFLLRDGDDFSRIRGRHVSANFFDVLGLKPFLGQTFDSKADEIGGPRQAILSHELWAQARGSDPDIVGKTIDVGVGEPFEIVGVMPKGCAFPQDSMVWLSFTGFLNEPWLRRYKTDHSQHGQWVVGRLREGVSARQAQVDLTNVQRAIYEAPENQKRIRIASRVEVVPILDQLNGSETRSALLFLLGAVGFVLLIACVNVANLLLTRATSRRREMAIRVALGAGRLRVIRQMLTESLLLSMLGAVAAVIVAMWGVSLLKLLKTDVAYLGVKELRFDRYNDVSIDYRVLLFTFAVSAVTGIIFGLIPALQASRIDINRTLKDAGRSGSGGRGIRLFRNSLVVIEVALAVVLLTGAGVALRGFGRMLDVDTGLQTDNVLHAEIDLAMAQQVYGMSQFEAFDEAMTRLRAIPGIEAVGSFGESPLVKSGWNDTLRIIGTAHDNLDNSELPSVDVRAISPGAFQPLGIPLIAGRDFDAAIDVQENPHVAIVNKAFVEKLCGDKNPVGRTIHFRGLSQYASDIVGVVGNVRNYSRASLEQPEIYFPYRQTFLAGPEIGPTIVMQVLGDSMSYVTAVRDAVDGSDPSESVMANFTDVKTLLAMSASQEKFQATLLTCFSGIALLLAVVGVYGVMSYSTSQRFQEIGIRIALGARPLQILKSVLAQGITLSVIGVVIGTAATIVLARIVSGAVYGIESLEGITLSSVAGLLLLVGTIASLIPAIRATQIDPLAALRHE